MKKLLLIIAIAITFLSCTPESITEDTSCDCYKETWLRYNNGEWYTNGNRVYYSSDCEDGGKEVGQPYSGQGYDYKYIVNCE
jgi:hypothetical protein